MKQVLAVLGLVFVLAVDATAQSQAGDRLTLYAPRYNSETIKIERGDENSECRPAGSAKGEATAIFYIDSSILGEIYGVPHTYHDIANRMSDDIRLSSQDQYISYARSLSYSSYEAERQFPSRLFGFKSRFVSDGGVCARSTTVAECLRALRDEVVQEHGRSKDALEVNTPEGFELKPHSIETRSENPRDDVRSWKVRQFYPLRGSEPAVDYTGDLHSRIVKTAGRDVQFINCGIGSIPDKKVECFISVEFAERFEYCGPSGSPVSTY